MFSVQARRPEFRSPLPIEKPGIVVLAYNPHACELETGGALGSGHFLSPNLWAPGLVRNCFKKWGGVWLKETPNIACIHTEDLYNLFLYDTYTILHMPLHMNSSLWLKTKFIKKLPELGLLVHACNPRAQVVDGGVSAQAGPQDWNKRTKRKCVFYKHEYSCFLL